MKQEVETISINGVEYVKKTDSYKMADKRNDMKYVIVRTYSAGVFAGYLESRDGKEVVMRDARRIWYWDGAASLSQLAMEGTKSPENCKFPCSVDRVELIEVIEILDVTEQAKKSIESVAIWEK